MYDDISKDLLYWFTYRHCKILNFSETLHKLHKKWNFNSLFVKYFPEPGQFIEGDPQGIFFWQRTSDLNLEILKKVITGSVINNLHFHKAIDPGQNVQDHLSQFQADSGLQVTSSHWFEDKNELNKVVGDKAFYFAPRKYEGIGMSFLEAMAMGKIVIAPNYPTMNEYIVDRFNGILYDFENPKGMGEINIKQVQNNAYKFIENGRKNWLLSEKKIIEFIG